MSLWILATVTSIMINLFYLLSLQIDEEGGIERRRFVPVTAIVNSSEY
jgi:hypothetical protein